MQMLHSDVDALPPDVHSEVDADRDGKVDADRDGNGAGFESIYDELYEILSWMPAKCAIKYSSSLCKRLCNIHLEPRFIKKQCIHSFGQDHGFFLQESNYYCDVPNNVGFHVFPEETGSAIGIPHESLDYLPKQGHLLSSSNGLLLLGLGTGETVEFHFSRYETHIVPCYGFKLMLCNPTTREWAPLGTPEGFTVMASEDNRPLIECYPWGHGIDFPNDYLIALPAKAKPPKPQLDIDYIWYLVREGEDRLRKNYKKQLLIYCNGRWEEELCDVNIEGRVVSYDMPVMVFSDATKGLMLHYMCHSDNESHSNHYPRDRDPIYLEPYIAAFDIQEKKLSREIKLPEEAWHIGLDGWHGGSHNKLWIFKWNDTSICLVRTDTMVEGISVWVLDKYGCEGESWRLIMTAKAKKIGIDKKLNWVNGVRVVSGGRLLISTTKRVYVYVMEGEHCGKLEVVLDHGINIRRFTLVPYANTLRPVSVRNVDTLTY